LDRFSKTPPSSRLLIGISGIPASGKSTIAKLIVDHTNTFLREEQSLNTDSEQLAPPEAALVSLDGWHLTRAQLDALPNPKLAHDRRGIHWSFDAQGYASFVQALRQGLHEQPADTILTAPSFDHALKDPTPDAIAIHPFHRIVIIEGLYTFLSINPWRKAGELFDERWLVQAGFAEATERIVKRHVATGVAKDVNEAIWRAEENGKYTSYSFHSTQRTQMLTKTINGTKTKDMPSEISSLSSHSPCVGLLISSMSIRWPVCD